MTDRDTCNTCGCRFDCDADCFHAKLMNQCFGATLDADGNVLQECCELCQQDLYDSVVDIGLPGTHDGDPE